MGHFCWCCERERRNEKFTGRGHRDHLCKDCQKLPKKEREIRQALRNIDQLFTWEGFVRNGRRKELDKYLEHPDERVREYAQQLQERDRKERELQRKLQQQEDAEIDKWSAGFDPDPYEYEDTSASSWSPPDDDIPF